jgi:hypothetical protein
MAHATALIFRSTYAGSTVVHVYDGNPDACNDYIEVLQENEEDYKVVKLNSIEDCMKLMKDHIGCKFYYE